MQKFSILNIGDPKNISSTLASKLADIGVDVEHLPSLEETFPKMASMTRDMIIVDLGLKNGEMDTWSMYTAIREKSNRYCVDFVFITSKPDPVERLRATFAGIKAYLDVPVNQQVLEEVILNSYEKKQAGTKKLQKRSEVKGNLKSIPISDILQMVVNNRKSGLFRLHGSICAGEIFFIEGNILNVRWKNEYGNMAFLKLCSQKEGDFEFEELLLEQIEELCPKEGRDEFSNNWLSLLLESARISDEIEAMRTSLPTYLNKQEIKFLEEVIFRGIASGHDITCTLSNKDTNVDVVEMLVRSGLITEESKEEIANFLTGEESFGDSKSPTTSGVPTSCIPIERSVPMMIEKKSTSTLRKKSLSHSSTQSMRLSSLIAQNTSSKNKASITNTIFQRLLLALSLVTPEQLNHCVQEQVKLKLQNVDVSLRDLLLNQGYLTAKAISNLFLLKNEHEESFIHGYKIIKFIGEGAKSAVYLGSKDGNENFRVAVKVFVPSMEETSTSVVRFIRECEISKMLEHPNIVKAYEFGDFFGLYYIVMEYIEGVSLAEKIINEGAIDEPHALEIFEEILHGMYKAWGQNFIHRDIKPSNIMIGKNQVKICDFGLAKSMDSDVVLTQAGTIVGTPHYMSPEQFSGEEMDYRTDVYSLGVTLYVMLSAHLPFSGTTYSILGQSHLEAVPPLPSYFHVTISKPMLAFLFKMLSKNSEDRCQSPEELLDNLHRVKQGKMPKGVVRYFQQKRKKFLMVLTGISVPLVVFASIIFLLWSHYSIQQKEQTKRVASEPSVDRDQEQKLKEKEIHQREHEAGLHNAKIQEQARLALQTAQEFLLSLKFDLATNELARIEKDFSQIASLSDIQELRLSLLELKALDEAFRNGNFLPAIPKILELEKQPQNSLPVYALLKKYFYMGDEKQKREIFGIGLRLSQVAQKEMISLIEAEKYPKWTLKIIGSLPPETTQSFISLLLAGSPTQQNYGNYLQSINHTVFLLKASLDAPERLKEIALPSVTSEVLQEAYQCLSHAEKEKLVQLTPQLLLMPREICSSLFQCLEKEADSKLCLNMASKLGENAHPLSQEILSKMLQTAELPIRMEVVKIATQNQNGELLLVALNDSDSSARSEAMVSLSNLKKGPQQFLIRALGNSDPSIRKKAVQVLGNLKSRDAVSPLSRLLSDGMPEVAQEAAMSLAKIQDHQAIELLKKALDSVQDEKTGVAFVAAIGEIGGQHSLFALVRILLQGQPAFSEKAEQLIVAASPLSIAVLVDTLKADSLPIHRRKITEVLEKIGSPAVPKLCLLLQISSDIELQRSIIKTLGHIGDSAASPTLKNMSQHQHLKFHVQQAIEKIANKSK